MAEIGWTDGIIGLLFVIAGGLLAKTGNMALLIVLIMVVVLVTTLFYIIQNIKIRKPGD